MFQRSAQQRARQTATGRSKDTRRSPAAGPGENGARTEGLAFILKISVPPFVKPHQRRVVGKLVHLRTGVPRVETQLGRASEARRRGADALQTLEQT